MKNNNSVSEKVGNSENKRKLILPTYEKHLISLNHLVVYREDDLLRVEEDAKRLIEEAKREYKNTQKALKDEIKRAKKLLNNAKKELSNPLNSYAKRIKEIRKDFYLDYDFIENTDSVGVENE